MVMTNVKQDLLAAITGGTASASTLAADQKLIAAFLADNHGAYDAARVGQNGEFRVHSTQVGPDPNASQWSFVSHAFVNDVVNHIPDGSPCFQR
jgi:hypothetical protein